MDRDAGEPGLPALIFGTVMAVVVSTIIAVAALGCLVVIVVSIWRFLT